MEEDIRYIVLDDETKRLLDVRKKQKSKKPHFKQSDSHKKKKLEDKWKKPRGIHNKLRTHTKGKGGLPERGYGSPVIVRGLHPSGFEDVVVSNSSELDGMNPEKQAVRIARTVGLKKRAEIEKKTTELKFRVLNPTRSSE